MFVVVVAVWLLTRVHYYGGRVEKFVMVKNQQERVESSEVCPVLLSLDTLIFTGIYINVVESFYIGVHLLLFLFFKVPVFRLPPTHANNMPALTIFRNFTTRPFAGDDLQLICFVLGTYRFIQLLCLIPIVIITLIDRFKGQDLLYNGYGRWCPQYELTSENEFISLTYDDDRLK